MRAKSQWRNTWWWLVQFNVQGNEGYVPNDGFSAVPDFEHEFHSAELGGMPGRKKLWRAFPMELYPHHLPMHTTIIDIWAPPK